MNNGDRKIVGDPRETEERIFRFFRVEEGRENCTATPELGKTVSFIYIGVYIQKP